jgi:uncharacterized protein (DUF2252 family)
MEALSLPPGLSIEEARRLGRSLRSTLRRRDQAELVPLDRDPVAIIESQHATRLPHLVPIRVGRMLQSPFAYYRGTAAVMAADLADAPRTRHHVVICGDAHIANFGLFASPERRVLFDLNDFDEVSVGPWEWDVKRMATSVVLATRAVGHREDQVAEATRRSVAGYRRRVAAMTERSILDRFYLQVEADLLERQASASAQKVLRRTVKGATRRTADRVLDRITTTDSGRGRMIVDQPPLMAHISHFTLPQLVDLGTQYLSTLRADVALLVAQLRPTDYALRVVGVGSVGTRCYIVLLLGPADEPMFLQVKEAGPSVIQTYGKVPSVLPPGVRAGTHGASQGFRVVSGQRILQAQSDPFLGWVSGTAPDPAGDHRVIDFYWRQFRDMKGSVDLEALAPAEFAQYAELCGALLARAHSQSPQPAILDAYLGRSEVFDDAVTTWSLRYADQVERDFAALQAAVASGRLPAEQGV